MASDSYVRLSLDDLLGFIRGNELALIYSDLIGGPPNAFVIKELQKSHPTLCVGAVTAFVLHQVPADLQQHLADELHRRGLNGLWLPTGYYLFLHGKLVGHHYPPPVNIRSYAPLFVLAGFALMERLLTDRWGKTVNLIEPTLDITIGVPIVAELRRQILQALLDDAKYRVHDQENEHTHEQAQADDPSSSSSSSSSSAACATTFATGFAAGVTPKSSDSSSSSSESARFGAGAALLGAGGALLVGTLGGFDAGARGDTSGFAFSSALGCSATASGLVTSFGTSFGLSLSFESLRGTMNDLRIDGSADCTRRDSSMSCDSATRRICTRSTELRLLSRSA